LSTCDKRYKSAGDSLALPRSRRYSFEDRIRQRAQAQGFLHHLSNDILGRLIHNASVGSAADVVKQQLLALWASSGEEGRAVDGSKGGDSLGARVELTKARDLSLGIPALLAERAQGVGKGHGSDWRVVEGAKRFCRFRLQEMITRSWPGLIYTDRG